MWCIQSERRLRWQRSFTKWTKIQRWKCLKMGAFDRFYQTGNVQVSGADPTRRNPKLEKVSGSSCWFLDFSGRSMVYWAAARLQWAVGCLIRIADASSFFFFKLQRGQKCSIQSNVATPAESIPIITDVVREALCFGHARLVLPWAHKAFQPI